MVDFDFYLIGALFLISNAITSMLTIAACFTGALFTRKAYTKEPLFEKEVRFDEDEEEIELPESEEEKELREHQELNRLAGF